MANQNVYWKDDPNANLVKYDKDMFKNKDGSAKYTDDRLVERIEGVRKNAAATMGNLMKHLKEKDLVPELHVKDQNRTGDKAHDFYPSKATIFVSPAFTKDEAGNKVPLLYDKGDFEGEPVLSVRADIGDNTSILTVVLDANGKSIRGIGARGVDRGTAPTFFKQNEIQTSYLKDSIKAIAAEIEAGGFITQKGAGGKSFENATLNKLFYDAKNYFDKNSTHVTKQNKNGETFDTTETYVQKITDEFGEKMRFANSNPAYNAEGSTVVEVGAATVGRDTNTSEVIYVKLSHFTPLDEVNSNGKPMYDVQSAYINQVEELNELVDVPEIKDVVGKFMVESKVVGSLYAVMRETNKELEESGLKARYNEPVAEGADNIYTVFSQNYYEGNGHTYERLFFVENGSAVASISRDADNANGRYTVEAIQSDGENKKSVLITPKNLDSLIANSAISGKLAEFMEEYKCKTLEDKGKEH